MSTLRSSPSPEKQAMPLTEAQSGLWYVQRIDPQSPALNTGQYIELRGRLDLDAFTRAVNRMVAETDALALTFSDGPEGPMQRIDENRRPWLDIIDLSKEINPVSAALQAMQRDSDTPLDLANDRLAAFRLYILGPEHHFWYERIHHLAIDGYGMVLVTNRVGDLYSELTGGSTASPPPPGLDGAFTEDAAYRNSPAREKDHAFWHTALAGLPETVSLGQGKPVASHSFHRETLTIPKPVLARMTTLAERHNLIWPDVLTGIAASYCRHFSGAEEITIGLPFMGRLGSKAARIPCMLMNVLPLRVRNGDSLPLADYLINLAKDQMKARRHGRYRSEQLRRELGLIGGQRRLYGPLINVQPFDMPPHFAGLDTALHILGAGAVDDITFTFRGDAKQSLTFEVDANPAIYSPADVSDHARRFLNYLDAALDAENLADIPLASPDEIANIAATNATAHEVSDTTLAALVEATMQKTPQAPALRFGGHTLTYAELDTRSAALAGALQAKGAGAETIIAVALPRSFELVIALVAIIRAGAAWLPLDTKHPKDRLARILASAKPVCLLTDDATLFEGESTPIFPTTDWQQTGNFEPGQARPDSMAYVIYTSGSTGEPKGVVVEHRAIVNRLEWMRTHYGFGPDDRILQKTPATFDVSVWEFFLPFLSGATLVVAPPEAHRDPVALAAIIRDEAITTTHFVPSMLSAFLASPSAKGLKLRRVFCSGEELTAAHRDRFHATLDSELHNLYGPTEAAVDVSFWPATRNDTTSTVPIGYPVWNTQLHVFDEHMQPLPPGVPGHLYLGGVQLARGYLGRPDLTEDRFITAPDGARLYKTGDLARRETNGAITFLGRSDHQVKIRGLRIELGEIEIALLATGLVRETAVIARKDRTSATGSDKRLVAYIVGSNPSLSALKQALKQALASRLPDYMIPSAFVVLDALPVTANGKLDRTALPAPVFAEEGGQQAQTATEEVLARLFRNLLGLETAPSREADFFALGGDSLLAVHLTLAINEEYGFDPGLGAIFEQPVISALASLIDGGSGKADHGLGPVIRLRSGNGATSDPLFLIHPAGGIAWGYRHLAASLTPARDVYGLQADALDLESSQPENLETLAGTYAARIAALHPQGTIHLAGWSVGGIIAQAIATHLEQQGRKIGLVALLDSYPCECWRAEPEPDEITALRALLAIAGYDPALYPELTTRNAIIGFLREGDSPMGKLPGAALDGVVRAVLDTNRLVRQHYHRPYGGTLTHIRAALDHQDRDLAASMWAAHAASVEETGVPFLHAQLTTPEASAQIGPFLCSRLSDYDQQEQQ